MIKCLFLVEGPFDKLRLSLFNELFDSNKLTIIPFNCDKLSEENYQNNYRNDIQKLLENEKAYRIDDFDEIVQVCDMDGCYISDKYIVENNNINRIKYYLDRIEAINKEEIIKRNKNKRNNINKILIDKKIYLYFNASNIDHALDEIQNPTNKQKRDLSIRMYNTFKDKPKSF